MLVAAVQVISRYAPPSLGMDEMEGKVGQIPKMGSTGNSGLTVKPITINNSNMSIFTTYVANGKKRFLGLATREKVAPRGR